MIKICKKCNGTGHIGEGVAFINAGECPPESNTCQICNGDGYIRPKFFVEFNFSSRESGKIYWLPLFIIANNIDEANVILKSTNIAIKEKFDKVSHSLPIPEANFTKQYIETKHKIHGHQKLVYLDLKVWQFIDIKPNPDYSFDEHLEFIMNELPFYPRDIASEIESHRFPVRVVRKEGDLFNFDEILLINVVNLGCK
ncbi:MAG: hypothetical protein CVU05_01990 [Bacteroidetes bacterium HGW-Bacteroidetes-21]|jgi:hypothetical protein|nr:MAG: hypothetical protein CVU05_01990 [Bacteroidetes bacterium HGW-Bacteroidetes-21]